MLVIDTCVVAQQSRDSSRVLEEFEEVRSKRVVSCTNMKRTCSCGKLQGKVHADRIE